MKTPRTIKSAIENGYIITNIMNKGSKKCRVDLKPRFYKEGMKAIIGFWVSSAYVRRTYPTAFEKFNY